MHPAPTAPASTRLAPRGDQPGADDLDRSAAPSRDELVRAHLPLVGHLVRDVLTRVPAHVSRDDLTSSGMLALVQAADQYDAQRGVAFATYASTRIRGALLDELRSMDWASRSVRRRARQVDDTRARLATALGRPATDAEVASALGIGPGQLADHRDDVARAAVLSLQGLQGAPGGQDTSVDDLLPHRGPSPADLVEQREQVAYLHDAVSHLPERLRRVVEGYFFADQPMAELAAELGVSESRVSQLRAEAVALMRGALTRALDPERRSGHETPGGCAARRKEAYYASVASHRTFRARLSGPGTVQAPTA